MSSSLIKSYSVAYKDGEAKKHKRVIDSNQAVSDRIKELSEILESVPEEDFADDFNRVCKGRGGGSDIMVFGSTSGTSGEIKAYFNERAGQKE